MSARSSPRGSVSSAEREQLERERTVIRDGLLSNMRAGEVRYLITDWWYRQWTRYVGMGGYGHSRGDISLYPGPIDLTPLVDENGRLKRDLVELRHYRVVPEESWKLLVERYGVAEKSLPEIRRNVILARKGNSNVEIVELYPPEITVIPLWDPTWTLHVSFSRITTLDTINTWLRKHYEIPDRAESRLWHQKDSSDMVKLIDSSKLGSLTLEDFCINDDALLFFFETRKNASDPWPSSAAPDFVRKAVDASAQHAKLSPNHNKHPQNRGGSQESDE